MLAKSGEYEVIGPAGDGHTALRMLDRHKPDVIIMDVDVPGMHLTEIVSAIDTCHPACRVMVFTLDDRDSKIEEALRAGVLGYVHKRNEMVVVIEGVRSVARGKWYACRTIQARIVTKTERQRCTGRATARVSTLTPRELIVLRHVSEGLSVKEMAQVLHVSAKTVDNQKGEVMRKLDIHDRLGLCRFAVREGIVSV